MGANRESKIMPNKGEKICRHILQSTWGFTCRNLVSSMLSTCAFGGVSSFCMLKRQIASFLFAINPNSAIPTYIQHVMPHLMTPHDQTPYIRQLKTCARSNMYHLHMLANFQLSVSWGLVGYGLESIERWVRTSKNPSPNPYPRLWTCKKEIRTQLIRTW